MIGVACPASINSAVPPHHSHARHNGNPEHAGGSDPAYRIAQLSGDLDRFVFLLPAMTANPCPALTPAAEAP